MKTKPFLSELSRILKTISSSSARCFWASSESSADFFPFKYVVHRSVSSQSKMNTFLNDQYYRVGILWRASPDEPHPLKLYTHISPYGLFSFLMKTYSDNHLPHLHTLNKQSLLTLKTVCQRDDFVSLTMQNGLSKIRRGEKWHYYWVKCRG